ncbi:hypothetical protein [Marinobacter gelidimuriae]|jgi:hypothetical protein|uniref:hypothetical protein n=1 Tax=Marinobacter gelidimuriae TaxID=2739064 RepID=UPI00035CF7DB|nr:hypothetical protein [Marinobacter gelidimuriae]
MKKILLAGALLSLTGCYEQDPYDLKEVSGDTYLINKQTGSVALVKDARLIELRKLAVSTEKTLNLDSSMDQKVQINATAKQIEDRLFYSLELSNYVAPTPYGEAPKKPAASDLKWLTEALEENKYDRIILQFQDKDGFVLSDHTINLSEDYINIWDQSGEVKGLKYEDSISANPQLFSRVVKMTFVYAIQSLNNAPGSTN